MYWLILLGLMLLIPVLTGVQIWREARLAPPTDDRAGH